MEIENSISAFLWLCTAQVLPSFVISKFQVGGMYPASPLLVMLLGEAATVLLSWALSRSSNSFVGPISDASASQMSSEPSHQVTSMSKKVLAQLGGLSLLYTLTMALFLRGLELANVSTVSLLSSTSVWVSGLISVFYLQDSITSQQWLVIVIHLAGVITSLWNACTGGSLLPFWLYVYFFIVIYLQQLVVLWYGAILKHAKAPHHRVGAALSLFSLPLIIWNWLTLPPDLFPYLQPSSSSWSSLYLPVICMSVAYAISNVIRTSILAQKTGMTTLNWMAPVASTVILYLSDWFSGRAYVTLTVLIGLSTAAISVYSYLAFANDQGIRLQPGFRKRASASTFGIISDSLPDFIAVKCGWKHIVATLLFIFFIIVVFQSAPSTENSKFGRNSTIEGTQYGDFNEFEYHRVKKDIAPDSRIVYQSDDATKPGNYHFFDWGDREKDEMIEIDSLLEVYAAKRNVDAKKKSTAVCLAGNMKLGWANDLAWLQTLYRSIDSYDLFVWLGPESQPLGSGELKPRSISMAKPGSPRIPITRKFKPRGPQLDDWSMHLWAYGHCISLIDKHTKKHGTSYEFMLLALPNRTNSDFPIPKQKLWDRQAISFTPIQPNQLIEPAIFGPYDKVSSFAPQLLSAITSWTGTKLPIEYIRHLAKHLGHTIVEYK